MILALSGAFANTLQGHVFARPHSFTIGDGGSPVGTIGAKG
jgi:hypothetical protein